ncbi:MAG: hypothetical protein IT371_08740 [Deltaproteobacteria bacterium]|nr:hypothetical protein [Deltaproteobacteria bacterium]
MMFRTAAALLVLGLAACTQPYSMLIAAPAPLRLPSVGRPPSLYVRPPVDLRPQLERDGDRPRVKYFVFLGLTFVSASRGTHLTGPGHFLPTLLPELHQSLLLHLRSTGLFAEVSPARGELSLETELLHLVAAQYQDEEGMATLGGGSFVDTRNFLPHGTATLRLRLRRGSRLLAERVVRGTFLGGPEVRIWNLGQVARQALAQALAQARLQVASWVLEQAYAGTDGARMRAHYGEEHEKGHTFFAHLVKRDRTGVVFTELHCPSGRVVRSQEVTGIPLVGSPGEWIVSPYDPQGVRYPVVVYDGLTQHLAEHFVLHRLDQLAAFHYLGAKLTYVK